MNALKLSWKNIKYRPWRSGLSILLMAAGLTVVIVLLLTQGQIDKKFKENLGEVDLVVGAKGSPLQLVLSSVYHIDNPTGNIKEVQTTIVKRHPFVESTIPICLGDNYKGNRIVGTTLGYISMYKGELSEGRMWSQPMEIVVGANIQEKYNFEMGKLIAGGHGIGDNTLEENSHSHDDKPYEVVGVLKPTGTVIDNLLLCEYRSSWIVHSGHADNGGSLGLKFKDSTEIATDTLSKIDTVQIVDQTDDLDDNHEGHNHDEHEGHDYSTCSHGHHHHHHEMKKVNVDSILPTIPKEAQEITSLLVKYKNQKAQMTMPAMINGKSMLMAADPDIERDRMLNLVDSGIKTATYMGIFVLIISAISVFISLYSSLRDRGYEIALMRTLGANKFKVFFVVIAEGILLSILGYILALILSHVGMWVVSGILENSYHYKFDAWAFSSFEFKLLPVAIAIGLISALIPAMKAYRTDISTTLSK